MSIGAPDDYWLEMQYEDHVSETDAYRDSLEDAESEAYEAYLDAMEFQRFQEWADDMIADFGESADVSEEAYRQHLESKFPEGC